MLQDCTAVKTLLLRLRRTLQESTDTSPASSLHSLPISPCSDKSLPFKDPVRDESQSLLLQLKDKDELILRLQSELDKARSAQKPPCQKADRSTQTDLAAPEGSAKGSDPVPSRRELCLSPKPSHKPKHQHKGPKVGAVPRGPAQPPPRGPSGRQRDRSCPALHPAGGRDPVGPPRRAEVSAAAPRGRPGPPEAGRAGQPDPRAVAGSSSSLPAWGSPSRSLSSDSERGPRSERGPLPRPTSSFTGRLGQPRAGLSLHMYSRKNVFLQHSLHTAELQALAQQDG